VSDAGEEPLETRPTVDLTSHVRTGTDEPDPDTTAVLEDTPTVDLSEHQRT
jgi:hypothetical protein